MTNTKTTLHIIRKSPSAMAEELQLCMNMLLAKDAVVLLDDGCYLTNHVKIADIKNITKNIYMLESHQIARAVNSHDKIELISLAQLNDLIFKYDNSVTWQ